MRWPFGPPHLTLKPSKKNNKKQKTRNKEGLGPSEVALRATSPDPSTLQKKHPKNKANKKTQKTKKKRSPPQKTAKIPKIAFQLSVKFFHFSWWLFKISLFWHLGPKSLNPKNTIKIGVSGLFFGKAVVRHGNGHFWTKTTKIHKFQLSFFCLSSSLSTTKKPQKLLKTPIFIVF